MRKERSTTTRAEENLTTAVIVIGRSTSSEY